MGTVPALNLLSRAGTDHILVTVWQVVQSDGLITAKYSFIQSEDSELWNFTDSWHCKRP